MKEAKVTINSELGVHPKAAVVFVELANSFSCETSIEKDGTTINAKSIMGLMMLALTDGDVIKIQTSGIQEDRALEELVSLVKADFKKDDLL